MNTRESVSAWVRKPATLSRYDGPLLLDTHAWMWHLEGSSERMAAGVHPLLERCGVAGGLRVLDISYWEVAIKAAKGQLVFSIDAAIWLKRARQAADIRSIPLHHDILLLSTRLVGAAHNDPADRMLIAAAQLDSVPLVTTDRRIIDYAKANPGTPVVDARRRRHARMQAGP